MRLLFGSLLLAASCVGLAACDRASPPIAPGNSSPVDPGTAPAEKPFECPAGMPSYKCEQLKNQNDPNYQPAPPPPS